jgi:thiol-disulfide isomerase/thioredoxin
MHDEAAGRSTAPDARTLRRIDLPDRPVAGGLHWFDPDATGDQPRAGEHPLTGRVELPEGARVTVYTDGDAPPPDLGFLDALPADLPTALFLHGVRRDDVAGLRRFTGVEMLGLHGDLDDGDVADLVAALPRLYVVDVDGDGLTGRFLAALPPQAAHVTVSSRRLDPRHLAGLAGRATPVTLLGLGRVAVDDDLVDAAAALRPGLRSTFFDHPTVPPTLAHVERLLAAGLEVDGFSAAPGATDRFAPLVLEGRSHDPDPDDAAVESVHDDGHDGAERGDGDDDELDRPLRVVFAEAELDALVAEGRPVLVDLTATWCGPCQALKPVLHEIDVELDGRLTIVAVDLDDAPWAEDRFGVQSIPTMVLHDGGRELGRISGAHPKRALLAMLGAALPALAPGAALR